MSRNVIPLILGYGFGSFIGGKKEGEPGRVDLEWMSPNINGHIIHIHHWFTFTIIILILLRFDRLNEPIFWFLLGGIIQGLTYNDWHTFTKRVF